MPQAKSKIKNQKSKWRIIWLSPSGKQFTNAHARSVAKKYTDSIIVCGRYEGIDARVKKVFKMEEISVGPFVLTGGELPAMIIMDVVSRQIEGVLDRFIKYGERFLLRVFDALECAIENALRSALLAVLHVAVNEP